MGSSSSDDLHEMMKTLASNTVTLQQNVMSFNRKQGQVFTTWRSKWGK
jgi:hypothetical protein